ncbi:MAG: nitroreductase family protein [Anaerolineaceae bacterium]|nr:nitroreductase family protein [Anaerolineaceae bacterium]
MIEIRIDQDKCIGCGACVALCSVTHVFTMENQKARVLSPSRCWECGQCIAACPVDAITHSSFSLENCPIIERSENDFEQLINYFRARRSIRVYQNKPVEREKVEVLVNITRWAPSGKNLQAISWLAIDNAETISRLSEKTVNTLVKGAEELRKSITLEANTVKKKEALMQAKTLEHLGRRFDKGEHPIFFGAPVLLAAITPRSHFGRDDAIISGYTLQLAAAQIGLATCQIGYFMVGLIMDKDLGKDIFPIPDGQEIQMVLTLGYPKYKMRRSVYRAPLPFHWVDE